MSVVRAASLCLLCKRAISDNAGLLPGAWNYAAGENCGIGFLLLNPGFEVFSAVCLEVGELMTLAARSP